MVSHEPRLNPDITRAGGDWLGAPGPPINTLTAAALRRYDVGRIKPGTAYAAAFPAQQPQDVATIPTLADVFALDSRVRFAVELKTFPDQPALTVPPEEMADRALAIADRAGVTARVTVLSFDWRILRHLRRARPDVGLGWLTKAQPEHEQRLWWNGPAAADFGGSVAQAVAAEAGQLWIPQSGELDAAAIATAHARGLRVIPWDVAPDAALPDLIALGLDGIITDRPDLALVQIPAQATH